MHVTASANMINEPRPLMSMLRNLSFISWTFWKTIFTNNVNQLFCTLVLLEKLVTKPMLCHPFNQIFGIIMRYPLLCDCADHLVNAVQFREKLC